MCLCRKAVCGEGWGGRAGLERLENDRWWLCVSVCERVNTQWCSGLFFLLWKKCKVTNIDLKTKRAHSFLLCHYGIVGVRVVVFLTVEYLFLECCKKSLQAKYAHSLSIFTSYFNPGCLVSDNVCRSIHFKPHHPSVVWHKRTKGRVRNGGVGGRRNWTTAKGEQTKSLFS